jgi:hypothetical protein
MYSYKPLDGTVAVEAAGLAGMRGDMHSFRALYGRYLKWLGEEGQPLTRQNCSAKAFKEWIELDMEETDAVAVAASAPKPQQGFPDWFLEWMPEPEGYTPQTDGERLCRTLANFILLHPMLTESIASYGAVIPGEMLRRFRGDEEADRRITAIVADFDKGQRNEFETCGVQWEPTEGLGGCLFADWRSRFGIKPRPMATGAAGPSKPNPTANEALKIIKGWPFRKAAP